MGIFGRREVKASRAGRLLSVEGLGRPVWTPRDYASLAQEGFSRNPVVFRSVRMIAEAAASAPWLLYSGDVEVERHPLLDLLRRPNPAMSGVSLFETLYGHLMVAGNAYLEVVSLDRMPRELFSLRPDRMTVVPGPDGWPAGYEYKAGSRVVRFAQEGDVTPVLHLSLFHPLNDHYGFAPIEAAQTSLDIHNASGAWAKALLDNAARPSGALVYTGEGHLSDEQFERLKGELEDGYSGAKNAGKPMLLEGGLDWKTMSMSPKDMDFIEAKREAAREIALAFGVPPMLLGIPGDNTYANYREANRAFWRQTVLPLVNRTAQSIGNWLGGAWGGELRLSFDVDQIEALAEERQATWDRVAAADFLSEDEKRVAVGYSAKTAPAAAIVAPAANGAALLPALRGNGAAEAAEPEGRLAGEG